MFCRPPWETSLNTRCRSRKEIFHTAWRSLIPLGILKCRLNTWEIPTASACRLPKVWDMQQVFRGQWLCLFRFCFSFTLLKIQNNPTDGSQTLGVSAHRQHLETWSTVEVAATCAYLFVSILTSSSLLMSLAHFQELGCSYITLRQNPYKRIWRNLWLGSPLIPGFPSDLSAQLGYDIVMLWGILCHWHPLGTRLNVEDEVWSQQVWSCAGPLVRRLLTRAASPRSLREYGQSSTLNN